MAGKSPLGKAREAPRISASLGGYLGGKDHPSAMEEKPKISMVMKSDGSYRYEMHQFWLNKTRISL